MSPMLLFETVYSYRKIVDLYAHLSGFNRTSSSWDWNVKQLSPFRTTLSPTIYIWNGFLCRCCCFLLVLTRYLSIWLRNFSVEHTQWVSVCVCFLVCKLLTSPHMKRIQKWCEYIPHVFRLKWFETRTYDLCMTFVLFVFSLVVRVVVSRHLALRHWRWPSCSGIALLSCCVVILFTIKHGRKVNSGTIWD